MFKRIPLIFISLILLISLAAASPTCTIPSCVGGYTDDGSSYGGSPNYVGTRLCHIYGCGSYGSFSSVKSTTCTNPTDNQNCATSSYSEDSSHCYKFYTYSSISISNWGAWGFRPDSIKLSATNTGGATANSCLARSSGSSTSATTSTNTIGRGTSGSGDLGSGKYLGYYSSSSCGSSSGTNVAASSLNVNLYASIAPWQVTVTGNQYCDVPYINSISVGNINYPSDAVCSFSASSTKSSINGAQYQWFINGAGQSTNSISCSGSTSCSNSNTLSHTSYSRGNTLYCKVRAKNSDGTYGDWQQSNTITVGNPPAPVSSLSATSPPDGSQYASGTWTKNNVKTVISVSNGDQVKYCNGNSCSPSNTVSAPWNYNWTNEGTTVLGYAGYSSTYSMQESTQYLTMKIDKTAPNTSISATSGGSSYTADTWTNNPVDITLSCSDSGIGCSSGYPKYCIDTSNSCNPIISYTSQLNINDSGISYIRYYSKDDLDNIESVQSQSIKINSNLTQNTSFLINGNLIWNHTDYFSGSETTLDFSQQLNDALDNCQEDSDGYCNIPLTFHSDGAGNLNISNININYNLLEYFWNIVNLPKLSTYQLRIKASDGELNSSWLVSSAFSLTYPNDTNKLFIQNSADETVAWMGDSGNLLLMGVCNVSSNCVAPQDSLVINNASGDTVAYFDNTGNLCIEKGSCSNIQSQCNPSNDAFIIQDSLGNNKSYIDSEGSLCLTGGIYENANI